MTSALRLTTALLACGISLASTVALAQAPEIVLTSPVANELGVFVSSDISVTFSVDLDETTLNDSTFLVDAGFSGPHQGVISYDVPSRTATFDPEFDFTVGEIVHVVLTTGIESSSGIPLASGFVWRFEVAADDGIGAFAPYYDHAVGQRAFGVMVADLDGDGDLDLAATNSYWSGNVAVMLGNGDGTFNPRTIYAVGDWPGSVIAADLDGDSYLDLAVSSHSHANVAVLLNDGDGTFTSSARYNCGQGTSQVVGADFDGDGDIDLATANRNSDNVSVLRNNGDGTFAPRADYAVGHLPLSLAAGDLDGDGDVDIVTANVNAATVSVCLNNGNGTFAAHTDYAVGSGPYNVDVCDLDVDGDLDLVTANNFSGDISILLGDGNGNFAPEVSLAASGEPVAVVASDVDGDGDLDLACANSSSSDVCLLLNQGDASFGPFSAYPVSEVPTSITAGDIDGDGDLDLLAGISDGNAVSLLLNQLALVVDPLALEFAAFSGGSSPASCVLNVESNADPFGYSISDDADWLSVSDPVGITPASVDVSVEIAGLVAGEYASIITVNADSAENSPESVQVQLTIYDLVAIFPAPNELAVPANSVIMVTFGTEMDESTINTSTFVVNSRATGLLQGMIDYDSATQMVTFDPTGDFTCGDVVTVMLTTGMQTSQGVPLVSSYGWSFTTEVVAGTGAFGSHTEYPVDSHAQGVIAGRLNGDSYLDLATANGSYSLYGTISIAYNNGSGQFPSRADFPAIEDTRAICAADFDRDGDLDLATAEGIFYSPGDVGIFWNYGNGTFTSPDWYDHYSVGSYPQSVVACDLDGDGDVDLAAAVSEGHVAFLDNNADSTFGPRQDFPVGGYARSIVAADLDGDGDFDLATGNSAPQTVSILENNGNATFAPFVDYPTGGGAYGLAAGDFDADGDIDLATADYASYGLSILLNGGDATFTASVSYPTAGQPVSICAADADGDGDLDLITANSDSSSVSVLFNDGNAAFPLSLRYQVGNTPVSVFAADLDLDGDLELVTANRQWGYVSVLYGTSEFVCGDADHNGFVNVSDCVYLLVYIFGGGPAPIPYLAGDVDCNTFVNISDAVYIRSYIFSGGPEPCADCP